MFTNFLYNSNLLLYNNNKYICFILEFGFSAICCSTSLNPVRSVEDGFFIFIKSGMDLVGDYYALLCMTRIQCMHSSGKNRRRVVKLRYYDLKFYGYCDTDCRYGRPVCWYACITRHPFFCTVITTRGTRTRQTAICRYVPIVIHRPNRIIDSRV